MNVISHFPVISLFYYECLAIKVERGFNGYRSLRAFRVHEAMIRHIFSVKWGVGKS